MGVTSGTAQSAHTYVCVGTLWGIMRSAQSVTPTHVMRTYSDNIRNNHVYSHIVTISETQNWLGPTSLFERS